MKRVGKTRWVRLTPQQENFVSNIMTKTNKTYSDVIRDLVQQTMESNNNKGNEITKSTVYAVKTYSLLKQFIKDYHDEVDDTLANAEAFAQNTMEAIAK